MMWATLIGLEELMQELDTLGRRRQTADGGWLDVFTRRWKGRRGDGAGRGQEGALALAGAVASRCRVRHDVSICAGAGGEATVG